MIVNQQTTSLKEKAISEAKKFAVIVGYLWALFVLFGIHKITILRGQSPAAPLGYRVGFALINALIMGKIILIAEAFHFGERFKEQAASVRNSIQVNRLLGAFGVFRHFGGSAGRAVSSQDDYREHTPAGRGRHRGDVSCRAYGLHRTDTVFFLYGDRPRYRGGRAAFNTLQAQNITLMNTREPGHFQIIVDSRDYHWLSQSDIGCAKRISDETLARYRSDHFPFTGLLH